MTIVGSGTDPGSRQRRGLSGRLLALASAAGLAGLLGGCGLFPEPPPLWPYGSRTESARPGPVLAGIEGRSAYVAAIPPLGASLEPIMPAAPDTVSVFQRDLDTGATYFIGNNSSRTVAVAYQIPGSPVQTITIPPLIAVDAGPQRGQVLDAQFLRVGVE